ncbi:MAG: CBS domain-containing protein [Proteobacteria bacterium]|nr:CBS domain-containing protein [Pseudomonadota bacterium]
MNVKTIIGTKGRSVVTALESDKISDVAATLRANKIGALVISNDGVHVDGIVSERDIVHGLVEHGASLLDREVGLVMTREVFTCTPDESVDDLMAKMSGRRIRHLPCVDGDRLCGIVSIGDVVKYRLVEIEAEAEALRAYIATG